MLETSSPSDSLVRFEREREEDPLPWEGGVVWLLW